jgi:excisionase family DNA binding protein
MHSDTKKSSHKPPAPAGTPIEQLLTYAELATETGLPKGTLYALVSQGRIPHVRLTLGDRTPTPSASERFVVNAPGSPSPA